jgi:hypothetical protein
LFCERIKAFPRQRQGAGAGRIAWFLIDATIMRESGLIIGKLGDKYFWFARSEGSWS